MYLEPQWKMHSNKYKHAWYWFSIREMAFEILSILWQQKPIFHAKIMAAC